MTTPRRSFWSWFAWSKEAITAPEVVERLEKIESAVELRYLDKPQAEANKATGEAAAQLITALNNTNAAVIQIGTLLIIKVTNAAGQPTLFVRTLSQAELEIVETHPEMLTAPAEVLSMLSKARLTSGET